ALHRVGEAGEPPARGRPPRPGRAAGRAREHHPRCAEEHDGALVRRTACPEPDGVPRRLRLAREEAADRRPARARGLIRRRLAQHEAMAVPATGATTPPAARTLGRLIGRVLLALLRLTPVGRWFEREFLAAGHVTRVEKNGYRFWGPVVAAILAAEVLGALADWLHRRSILEVKWPTISSTVGHLETLSPIL